MVHFWVMVDWFILVFNQCCHAGKSSWQAILSDSNWDRWVEWLIRSCALDYMLDMQLIIRRGTKQKHLQRHKKQDQADIILWWLHRPVSQSNPNMHRLQSFQTINQSLNDGSDEWHWIRNNPLRLRRRRLSRICNACKWIESLKGKLLKSQ